MSLVKYRLREVAADFGVTPKEVTEILSKYCEKPKSNNQVLTEEELNVIFDRVTAAHPIASLEQVFTVKPKEQPKAEAPKQERRPEQPRKQKEKKPAAPKAEAPKAEPKEYAPAAEGSMEQQIEVFIKGLLEHMGSDAVPHAWKAEGDTYQVDLVGENLGMLIGRRGETLDAIQ